MEDDAASWAEQRRAAAAEHAASQQRRAEAESGRAREVVAAFVRDAQRLGIEPERLTASAYSGGGRYRTDVTGWYIRQNRTLGVGTDGEFYILAVPGGLRARLTGVTLAPNDPPLVIGAGGRDGESMPIDVLLRMRLDAGNAFS